MGLWRHEGAVTSGRECSKCHRRSQPERRVQIVDTTFPNNPRCRHPRPLLVPSRGLPQANRVQATARPGAELDAALTVVKTTFLGVYKPQVIR